MRALACICGVVGGACWIVAIFVSGDLAAYVEWAGTGLLSVAALGTGFLIASGSLVWLRAIVGLGTVALAWSVVAAMRAELDEDVVLGGLGAAAVLLGLVQLARRPARAPRVTGSHAR